MKRIFFITLLISFNMCARGQKTLTNFKDANGKYGYKDKAGVVVIPAIYEDARKFQQGGLARVRSGDNWGFIDMTGKEIIPFKYQDADTMSEGLARVKLNQKWGFVDNKGKEIIPPLYQNVGNFHEGVAWVKMDDKFWYIDKTGKIITSTKYEMVGLFSEGLAKVKLNGKWGYIDRKGKEVIPLKYDSTLYFENGLALVKANGKWGAIDKNSKEVIPMKYHLLQKDYFEWEDWAEETGWFIARLNPDDKSVFLDNKGNQLKFDNYNPYGFSEDMLAVSAGEKWGYIDVNLIEKIPTKYAIAEEFKNGLAMVKLNNKWGVIDKKGNEVISIQYDSLYALQDKTFMFKSNGKWGLLNSKGKEIFPAKYDVLGVFGMAKFSEGLMPVKLNGKWGYADSTGRLIIPAEYDEAYVFTDGKANVKKEGKSTRIDNPLKKNHTPVNVGIKTETKDPEPVKQSQTTTGLKSTIDPDLVGTWKYYDIFSNFNGYYIFRSDGSFDYWSDAITNKAPSPNLKNRWQVNGEMLELIYDGSKDVIRLKVFKKNDPQYNKPAVVIQWQPNQEYYRSYYSTESKPLWTETNPGQSAGSAPQTTAVKLAEPPVKLNGTVDLSLVGLWKATSLGEDYYMNLKADGTEETWSAKNSKKSAAYWRVDNGYLEVLFEGNSKNRWRFAKANDLVKGKPTIIIEGAVYYPQTEREMWRK